MHTSGGHDPEGREEVRSRLAEAARGAYEILGELGHGGMGWVFLGRDVRLGRLAALKVLPPIGALRPAMVERFQREAETAARLSHPHIVPVYGAGGGAEAPYFAMAYVEGETLATRLEREGALRPEEALRIAREVGDALAYAHGQGVVHRDIKPQNILLERETRRALVADFGVARALDADPVTRTGVAVGTPGYMAPEQASGGDVDSRADQYALGLVCYEMFTGRRFEADFSSWPADPTMVRAALRTGGRVSASAAAAIGRATALRRDDRFPDLPDFLAALEGSSAARRGRRRWMVAAGVAAVALAAVVGPRLRGARGRSEAAPAQGPGVALLAFDGDSAAADSLMPMLRYQLGGFATARVADPRVFDPPRGSPPGSDDVRQAARRAGAGWIVHGLIAGPPAAREILVRAVAVASARVEDLGRVRVGAMGLAAADSVVLLVARSEAGRALGLAPAGAPLPRSPEAAQAFAAAEEAFRRADYGGAAREYGRVARLDTGYVLARYKGFLASLQAEPTEAGVREAVRAIRGIVGRVGARERELLSAYLVLFDSGDVAGAERRLARLVAADPTFLDGWFALGEVRYHFGALAGIPPDSAEAAFLRALALWPGAAPAEMHLVALDLWFARVAPARERMARYLAVDSTSSVARAMQLGTLVLFGSLEERRAVLGRLGDLDERVLELGGITGVAVARDRTDLTFMRLGFQELARSGRSRRVRGEAANFVVATLLAEGRWSDARRELARYRAELPDDPELGRWPRVAAALGFVGAPPERTGAVPRLDAARVPFSAFASGWPERYAAGRRALALGDTASALAHLAAQDLLASVADAAVRGPVWLTRGRVLAARGDLAGAGRFLRRAANLLAYAEPPWDAVRDSARAELASLGLAP